MSRYLRFTSLILLVAISACAPAAGPIHTLPATQPAKPSPTVASTQAVPSPLPTPAVTLTAPPQVQSTAVNAAAFPDPAGFTWAEVASGFTRPVDFAELPGAPGHLLVVEQPGVIRLVVDGQLQPTPYLDLHSRLTSKGNEQGLLGLALHPRFVENGFFYVNYTDRSGNTVIARFQANSDGLSADPQSEKPLLHVNQPYANHNGGALVFGPDGYLYIALGDGGSAGDPHGNGQSLNTLLGKILRIDVDSGDPYAIPADNPFAKGGGLPEIWAYGLRNPWRITFDRASGNLYIADVGQDTWEEIDVLPAGTPGGANMGWNYFEGNHPFKGSPPASITFTSPVWEYSHDQGGCSVTGGMVYRGSLPEWQGIYLFSDYCLGTVWGMLRAADGTWKVQALFNPPDVPLNPSSFGQGLDGEVYLLDLSGGRLLKPVRR